MNRPSPQASDRSGLATKKLLVVDPSPITLEAISQFLSSQPDIEVVAQAKSADELLSRLRGLRRTGMLALIAMELPAPKDANWLIHTVREQFPTVRIAAFGAVFDRMSVSKALFMGADGYIDKRANPIQFLDAIRQIHHGEMVLAGVPKDWLGAIASSIEDQSPPSAVLTPREKEILTVAAQGLTAKQIASALGLAERTVTTHLANIYAKLEVGTRVAAVMKAANLGLISVQALSAANSRADVG